MAYERVCKADLRGFDKEATELILWAQDQGAKVKVSKKGHAIILAETGSTAVPRLMKHGNRTARNSRAAVARLFRDKE